MEYCQGLKKDNNHNNISNETEPKLLIQKAEHNVPPAKFCSGPQDTKECPIIMIDDNQKIGETATVTKVSYHYHINGQAEHVLCSPDLSARPSMLINCPSEVYDERIANRVWARHPARFGPPLRCCNNSHNLNPQMFVSQFLFNNSLYNSITQNG